MTNAERQAIASNAFDAAKPKGLRGGSQSLESQLCQIYHVARLLFELIPQAANPRFNPEHGLG